MKPSELIGPDDLLLGFNPADKWNCIQDLVEHLVQTGRLESELADAVREAVLSRERSMSTGMEDGVAIPHAALEDVSEVIACLGVIQTEQGLDFESIDGRPTRLVVLLVIPKSQKLLHIRTLADIARVLSKDLVRKELLAASEPERAHAVLVAGEA
ncbi:PTS system fructose-specific EIIABC component [Planctomycetes bacterium Poly30]|uniref:PTS system fructose-specific EIIABC component n=1 Tax=Saltatorellus ferox TaxID=2528018 RepID=A0A518ESS4_9BACT|nr:PTS system fructose-specific EIIABC component [Planctomycetes bacterium Poly30]